MPPKQFTTKHLLFTALATGGPLPCVNANGDVVTRKPILDAVGTVQREDGSGHCWNVTGYKRNEFGHMQLEPVTVFVRTID